jgi:hypothetical protein
MLLWQLLSQFVFYITNEMQLYNVLYYYQRSTCFGRFFRPSSEAYKTVCAVFGIVMLSCCLPLVWMGWKWGHAFLLSTAGVDGLERN